MYLLDVQTNPLNLAGYALIAERFLSMSAKKFGSQRLIAQRLEFGVQRLEFALNEPIPGGDPSGSIA